MSYILWTHTGRRNKIVDGRILIDNGNDAPCLILNTPHVKNVGVNDTVKSSSQLYLSSLFHGLSSRTKTLAS